MVFIAHVQRLSNTLALYAAQSNSFLPQSEHPQCHFTPSNRCESRQWCQLVSNEAQLQVSPSFLPLLNEEAHPSCNIAHVLNRGCNSCYIR